MKNYFKDRGIDLTNICELCIWMDIVNSEEPPCKYCENYGRQEEPDDFDYQKLKEDLLK